MRHRSPSDACKNSGRVGCEWRGTFAHAGPLIRLDAVEDELLDRNHLEILEVLVLRETVYVPVETTTRVGLAARNERPQGISIACRCGRSWGGGKDGSERRSLEVRLEKMLVELLEAAGELAERVGAARKRPVEALAPYPHLRLRDACT